MKVLLKTILILLLTLVFACKKKALNLKTMTAEEFVKSIRELKPKESDLSELSYSTELSEQWLKQFDITKNSDNYYDDPILSIINNYDVSSLNINDFTFDNEPFDDGQLFCFGWDVTGDRIAIEKNSGKIIAYDVYVDRITSQCAENSESFLGALVEIMKFFREKILSDYEEAERDHRSREVAYIAALKAGGEEFEDYYKSLLWVE